MPNTSVIDLSHWDPADDYTKVKAAGVTGVIYKATQGPGFTDKTYVAQQKAAKAAGLKWGSYHFADGSPVAQQIDNYLKFASPDPDELFCLDWEDNNGDVMSLADVKAFITGVETALNRPTQCVIYSGNTVKDLLGNKKDAFLGARRLWLAQYGPTPVVQASWSNYWLWQYTDGDVGPTPHEVAGVGPCDISSYAGMPSELAAEWATGASVARPVVTITISAPAGVTVNVIQQTQ